MAREKNYRGIKLIITKDSEEMGKVAASLILERIKHQPKINLLLPTGTTPESVYKILTLEKGKTFQKVSFFNFDEYCFEQEGQLTLIPENHPASYRKYMKEHLFNKIIFQESYFPGLENHKNATKAPHSAINDKVCLGRFSTHRIFRMLKAAYLGVKAGSFAAFSHKENPGSYDQLIQNKGGIDLCLVALGEDGHIFGFNFPGTSFDSRTRLVKINESTRKVNQKLTGIETPEFALTTGSKTGMESKEIIVIVSGKRKAEILRKVLSSQPVPSIPATILKLHQNCTWIVDEDAASKLEED